MKSLYLLLASMLCAATCFAQTKADSLKAAAIFNKSKDAYAHLKTYVDMGTVSTINGNGIGGGELVFKTAYDGHNFNFDFYTKGRSNSFYTINRTGAEVKTWRGVTGKESTSPNLASALSAAGGVSSSTSFFVPRFLFPADFENYNYYAMLRGISIIGSENINGLDCYKIHGQGRGDGTVTIWIAKKDFLIRKIEGEIVRSPAKTEASLRRAIALGKARGLNYSNIENALKTYHEIGIRDSLRGHPRRAYTNKEIYLYFPTANGKVSPDLLKFRPNRIAGA